MVTRDASGSCRVPGRCERRPLSAGRREPTQPVRGRDRPWGVVADRAAGAGGLWRAEVVEPEPTTVLGIDETWFDRPWWLPDGVHDEGRIRWRRTDSWETGFVPTPTLTWTLSCTILPGAGPAARANSTASLAHRRGRLTPFGGHRHNHEPRSTSPVSATRSTKIPSRCLSAWCDGIVSKSHHPRSACTPGP